MNNFLKSVDINIKLNNIFKKRFNIDLFNDENKIDINDNLFGENFELRARDLVYLLFDIEKEFNITITYDDINNTKFDTINNVITVINSKIEKTAGDI